MKAKFRHLAWGMALILGVAGAAQAQVGSGATQTTATRATAAVASFEDFLAAGKQKFMKAVDAWHNARDPREKAARWQEARELADGLRLKAGMEKERPEEAVIEEVALRAPKEKKEIKYSGHLATVPLTILRTIDYTTRSTWDARTLDWVARRITADRFEVWTSKEGWLFDRQGKVLNHAVVPRRDGTGLEWFGAFIPDGRWVTTDLWSRDDSLYLYSREGKYLRELKTADMMTSDMPYRLTNGLIAWARSDGEGKGWIVMVGDVGTRKTIRVGANDFKPRLLNEADPWKLCYPRQLGARYGKALSDDGKLGLEGGTGGHGPRVGQFCYEVWTVDPQKSYFSLDATNQVWTHSFWWNNILAGLEGQSLGFWPGSHKVFVDVGRRETWFFNEQGDATGWIAARRIGDAAGGAAMLFRDGSGRVYTMGPNQKITAARVFTDPSGTALKPMMLFDDLKRGLFMKGDQLILAAWKRNGGQARK